MDNITESSLLPVIFVPEVGVTDRDAAIKVLVEKLFSFRSGSVSKYKSDHVCEKVIDRENTQSTGVGGYMAFPHVRLENWGPMAMVVGLSREGINFKCPDKTPAKIICLLISDINEPYIILKVMANTIRLLSESGQMDKLFDDGATDAEKQEMFYQCRANAFGHILASDIARPVKQAVSLETSIEEATHIMHLQNQDILPVVKEGKIFCGEISCLEVFQYGMPDFFKQLHTISFVRHIDPFERYFCIKKDLRVKDLYRKDVQPLSRDKTLVEIIFEMTVKKRSKLFVVDSKGVLVGAIDRFTIIDKILFF